MIRYLFAVGFMANTVRLPLPTPQSSRKLRRQGGTGAYLRYIQRSIIQAVGAQEKTVEVTISGNILTVVRVNSNLNGIVPWGP